MKKQMISAPSMKVPTANIAVNKSRVKLYTKAGDLPTYYLQKGQEFQIELFNPTTGTILAKITLNGNVISQGGLVLKPGQRIFLDRYLDVAKKFLFDTYEVANTKAVKEAIENNGDFKVEFFRESAPKITYTPLVLGGSWGNSGGYVYNSSPSIPSQQGIITTTNLVGNASTTNAFYSSTVNCTNTGGVTYDSLLSDVTLSSEPIVKSPLRSLQKKSKTIETGRVEQGSYSDQKFKTVNKDFDWFAFHTIEAKLLPISQKINTAEDINVKRYCTSCGTKLAKGHKFCASCGTKA